MSNILSEINKNVNLLTWLIILASIFSVLLFFFSVIHPDSQPCLPVFIESFVYRLYKVLFVFADSSHVI